MFSTLKRALESILLLVIGVPLWFIMMGAFVGVMALVMWLLGGGGIFDILGTVVTTAEAGFKHDWKLPEVVLVWLVVFLVVRKR